MADKPPYETHFQRLRNAMAAKNWDQVDAELARFSKFLGKQVLNPRLDQAERAAVFALGFASAATRRFLLKDLTKGKKKP